MWAGLLPVLADVASNESSTTRSLPPDSLTIPLRRATIWSRAQPMPRAESVHDERELREPQLTNCSIKARIDFSSTSWRATGFAGRGGIFGAGWTCGGSAGSLWAKAALQKNRVSPSSKIIPNNNGKADRLVFAGRGFMANGYLINRLVAECFV